MKNAILAFLISIFLELTVIFFRGLLGHSHDVGLEGIILYFVVMTALNVDDLKKEVCKAVDDESGEGQSKEST